jgi:endonuclease YncB( thermonuclease family)
MTWGSGTLLDAYGRRIALRLVGVQHHGVTVRYIAGAFGIIGASPDGDSVRFTPTNPEAFQDAGINVRATASGGVQLRLDAIDALEIHYTPPGHLQWQQPPRFGDGAAAALLATIGFADVVRDDRDYVTVAIPDQTPGYILTQFADKYGRPVAMAYPGQRPADDPDGTRVYLGVTEMQRSVNYQLLTAGWVYPTFYSKLYYDLRDVLSATAVAGRSAGTGLWPRTRPPGLQLDEHWLCGS